MASRKEAISQLFERLDGPYRFKQSISMSSGSARYVIDADVRDDAGLTMDMDSPRIDCYWFNEEQKLVLDFEGVGSNE